MGACVLHFEDDLSDYGVLLHFQVGFGAKVIVVVHFIGLCFCIGFTFFGDEALAIQIIIINKTILYP